MRSRAFLCISFSLAVCDSSCLSSWLFLGSMLRYSWLDCDRWCQTSIVWLEVGILELFCFENSSPPNFPFSLKSRKGFQGGRNPCSDVMSVNLPLLWDHFYRLEDGKAQKHSHAWLSIAAEPLLECCAAGQSFHQRADRRCLWLCTITAGREL